jgi:hypothetical protein
MSGFGAELRSANTDEAGKFEMTGLPRGDVVALAVADSASSKAMPFDLAATPEIRNVTIVLDVTGKISGVVVDTEGQPIAEAQGRRPNFMGGNTKPRSGRWRRGRATATANSVQRAGRRQLRLSASHRIDRRVLLAEQGHRR